jgi:hypothetical protein
MSSTPYLKAFNTQFFNFLDDIISIFPENKTIPVSKGYFETIKFAKPSSLVKVWYAHVYTPYKEAIEQGNIDFFLEKNYATDLHSLPNAGEIMKIIDSSLRDPLRAMDSVNKEHCTKYVQILSKLSIAYHASNEI